MDELEKFYRKKLEVEKVALNGEQLLQEAAHRKWAGVTSKKIYNFLKREDAPGEPGRWGRAEKPKIRVGMNPAKPGIYFIDYGEFHKNWASHNEGCTGFLVAVEQYTNKAFVLPTKGKDTQQWLDSIAKFVELSREVATIYSDRDSVAQSPKFREGLQTKYGIDWRFLKKGPKAFTAERMIGIVKAALSKVLAHQIESQPSGLSEAKQKKWVHLVEPFLKNYNGQKIAGTPYKRQSVNKENFNDFLAKLTGEKNFDLRFNSAAAGPFATKAWNERAFKFRLGDRVRLTREANWKNRKGNAFAKATMEGGFSRELFTVAGRQLRAAALRTKDSARRMIPVYRLQEMGKNGCIFYEEELQLADRK